MSLEPGDVVIDDGTPMDHPGIGGDGHGLVPRDYSTHPLGYMCPAMEAVDMPLIPRSEWSARIKEMETTKTRLSDVLAVANNGGPIEALYQNGWGFCWFFSTGHAVTAVRAMMGLPYVKLSPFAGAYIIKQGRNEGGWGALSLEWAMKHGIPSQDVWPNLKADMRLDTPEMRANAAKHKVSEAWMDLTPQVYNRNLTFDQFMTCLLLRLPVITDWNWWGHSVCSLDPVEVEPGSFGVRIVNSHGTDYRSQLMVIRGNRAIPNGAVAPRAMALAN